jgi:hypothetical protein
MAVALCLGTGFLSPEKWLSDIPQEGCKLQTVS